MISAVDHMIGTVADERIRRADQLDVFAWVVDAGEKMAHTGQPRALFVVGFDHSPRRIGRIRIKEHRLLGLGVVVPFAKAGLVDGAALPLLQRVGFAAGKAGALLFLGDREPIFVQSYA